MGDSPRWGYGREPVWQYLSGKVYKDCLKSPPKHGVPSISINGSYKPNNIEENQEDAGYEPKYVILVVSEY